MEDHAPAWRRIFEMAGDGFLKWPPRTLEMATCAKQQPAMNLLAQLIKRWPGESHSGKVVA
jgi:hypothetical protein